MNRNHKSHSCPNDIACYEADLQPLSLRREINMANPLGLIWKQGLADIEVEPSVPFNLLTPTTVLSNVTFNEDLKVKFIKHEEHPELLRQLALEIINNISSWALVIYTDGSKSDSGRTGSGIFMKTSTGEFRYRFRNPNHSSVFRSELSAISEALSLALDFKNKNNAHVPKSLQATVLKSVPLEVVRIQGYSCKYCDTQRCKVWPVHINIYLRIKIMKKVKVDDQQNKSVSKQLNFQRIFLIPVIVSPVVARILQLLANKSDQQDHTSDIENVQLKTSP
ncbi:RNase H domain-containing protein [Caerostris extrusa]|uniref:RNase H domain-containing protein n=1 Tax=Caerostris extrusa TaxID=172846 RepID=A0AAV4PYH6_CAEEX|nr:RNase H domain-containing protein [Caerostris extrusa]